METTLTRLAAAAAFAASCGVALFLVAPGAAAAPAAHCDGGPGKRTVNVPKDATPVSLDRGTKVFDFAFGDGRAAQARTRSIAARPEVPDLSLVNVQIEEALVAANGRTIAPDELTVTKDQSPVGDLVVCVLVDPRTIAEIRPGEYVGDVVVDAPGSGAVSVPVRATFRSSSTDAWLLAGAGAALGLVLRTLGELAAGRRRQAARVALRAYLAHWSFWLALASAPLLALAGYVTLYSGNDVWGAAGSDGWKLLLTCFGFQLGGVGLVDVLRR